MERNFTLPLGFAAAFHAALLLGFPHTGHLARPATVPIDPAFCFPRPIEPEAEVEPDLEPGQKENTALPEKPVIASPEPPVITSEAIFDVQRPLTDPRPAVDSNSIPTVFSNFGEGLDPGTGPHRPILGADLDNPPRTRLQPSPLYPSEGRQGGLHGEVWVEFRVDESGHVCEPRVLRSSHRMFEEPTLRAVARWRFEPGRRSGRIVSFKMSVPVIFSLND